MWPTEVLKNTNDPNLKQGRLKSLRKPKQTALMIAVDSEKPQTK